jgi:hypothetical protein
MIQVMRMEISFPGKEGKFSDNYKTNLKLKRYLKVNLIGNWLNKFEKIAKQVILSQISQLRNDQLIILES